MVMRIVVCSSCGSLQQHNKKCSICGAKVITNTELEKLEQEKPEEKEKEDVP